MEKIIYFNGQFLPYKQARVDLEDRGYLFADGVYEVVNVYGGKPFKLQEHLERLQASAQGLEIKVPSIEKLLEIVTELLSRNKCQEASIYIQLTRGTEPRTHAYGDDLEPNLCLIAKELKRHPAEYYQEGVKAITLPDERWARCYIKSIALLPNVLAKKQAQRAGAFEAILVRDGFVMEGSSSNFFLVKDGVIITPPASNYILNGITRRVIIAEARKLGYQVEERSIPLQEIYLADELFLTGTTTEVMPLTSVDGKVIGTGKVGEISQKLSQHYKSLL